MNDPIIEMCDMGHKYYKEAGTDTRCPHCLVIGLEAARDEARREHNVANDLFVVIAEIAKLVGYDDSEPEICRKTVAAVRQLVNVKEAAMNFLNQRHLIRDMEGEPGVDFHAMRIEEAGLEGNLNMALNKTVRRLSEVSR